MYSDHFEGVHPHTKIAYIVLFPATPGPGGEWVAHWKTYQVHPASDLKPTETSEAFAFVSAEQRRKWWAVVRKEIIWVRMPTTNSQLAYRSTPDHHWLDLTDGIVAEKRAA